MTNAESRRHLPVPAEEGIVAPVGDLQLRRWEARCRELERDQQRRWPTNEALDLLEAIRAYLFSDDRASVETAARAWAQANLTMPVLLRRLGALRDMMTEGDLVDDPGLNDRLKVVLDTVTTVATETAIAELADAALTDPLTGAGNRRAFEQAARVALAEAERAGHSVSIAAIDLKGLKETNDTHGHSAGDRKLAGLTASLRAVMRASDQVFRIGGDEFVVLLPLAPSGAVAELMTRATRFNAPAFSWGAATAPEDGADLDQLLELADARLYESRRSEGYYEKRRAGSLVPIAGPWSVAVEDATHGPLHAGGRRDERRHRRWFLFAPVAVALAALAMVPVLTTKSPEQARLAGRSSSGDLAGQAHAGGATATTGGAGGSGRGASAPSNPAGSGGGGTGGSSGGSASGGGPGGSPGAATTPTVPASNPTGPSPTQALALVNDTGAGLNSATDTIYYDSASSGSFEILDTVTSHSGKGPASVAFPGVGAGGWSHGSEVKGNSGANSFVSSSFSWSPNAVAPAAITISSVDGAGNTGTLTVSFVSDDSLPRLTVNAPANVNGHSGHLTFSGTTTQTSGTVDVYVCSGSVSSCDTSDEMTNGSITSGAVSSNSWSTGTFSGTANGQSYTVQAYQNDTNGGTGQSAPLTFTDAG